MNNIPVNKATMLKEHLLCHPKIFYSYLEPWIKIINKIDYYRAVKYYKDKTDNIIHRNDYLLLDKKDKIQISVYVPACAIISIDRQLNNFVKSYVDRIIKSDGSPLNKVEQLEFWNQATECTDYSTFISYKIKTRRSEFPIDNTDIIRYWNEHLKKMSNLESMGYLNLGN